MMRRFSLCTLASLLALQCLSACGNRSTPGFPDPYSQNLPQAQQPYDPTQDNTYTPRPDTPGYAPEVPEGRSYSVLRNVSLRVDPEISAHILHLEGYLEPKRQGDPVIFDDIRSFTFHIGAGEMLIDNANISRLKNKYTFNYPDAPIKDVQVEFLPGRIRMSGKMKQVFWVPFSMEGTITPNAEGKLLLTPDKIVAAGVSVKSMMDIMGLTTSKLISVSAERGLSFEGNNVVLDPSKLFPPPKIQGRVVGVEIQQGHMKLRFDSGHRAPKRQPPDLNASNYMHVYGGRLLIMNELQYGAELQMVDQNPSDPFDFYLGEYRRHLKAGYVKVANDQGTLITLMPDYTELGQSDIWDAYPGGRPQLRPYAAQNQPSSRQPIAR